MTQTEYDALTEVQKDLADMTRILDEQTKQLLELKEQLAKYRYNNIKSQQEHVRYVLFYCLGMIVVSFGHIMAFYLR